MPIKWSGSLLGTLRGMERKVQDTRPLMESLAKEMDVSFRAHFRMLEGRGNKNGWPSQHFWTREVMRNQTFSATDRRAVLSIASPAYLHKITGGIILPKKGKSLAIPQNAKAAALGGPKASGLKLKFVPSLHGKLIGYLIVDQIKIKGKSFREKIMYALVRSVNQAAMPDALPPQQELENRIASNIRNYLTFLSRL